MNHGIWQQWQQSEVYLLNEPEECPARGSSVWVRQAWLLFKRRKWTWMMMVGGYWLIIMLCMWGVAGFLAGKMPQHAEILGWIALPLAVVCIVLLTGGMMISAASLAEDDDLKFVYLFSGFQYHLKPLLLLSFMLMAWVVLMVGGVLWLAGMLPPKAAWFWVLIVFFVLFAVLAVGMCVFSIVLVVLHDIKPFQACVMSVRAFLLNLAVFVRLVAVWKALLIVVGCVLGMVGWLLAVWLGELAILLVFLAVPVVLTIAALAVLQMYTAYRNVWTNLPME